MLEDLLGQSSKIQEELAIKLAAITITEELDNIKVTGNGAREITSIEIPDNLLSLDMKEQLEDQLVVVCNRLLSKITAVEQEESAALMKSMLPPGFDNLFG
jgi:DNA-binding protein YbaB